MLLPVKAAQWLSLLLLLFTHASSAYEIAAWQNFHFGHALLRNGTDLVVGGCASGKESDYSHLTTLKTSANMSPISKISVSGFNSTPPSIIVFYQAVDRSLHADVFTCNDNNQYAFDWTAPISADAGIDPAQIRFPTGMGPSFIVDRGWRVHFQHNDGQVRRLTLENKMGADGRYILPARTVGTALAVVNSNGGGTDGRQTSVFAAASDTEILVTRGTASTGLWTVHGFPNDFADQVTNNTSPNTLSINTDGGNSVMINFNSSTGSIGVGDDGYDNRVLYYIGTDRQLYQVNATGNTTWGQATIPSASALADVSDAALAVASDSSVKQIWVFYVSGGKLIQRTWNQGTWVGSGNVLYNAPTLSQDTTTTSTPSSAPTASGTIRSDTAQSSSSAKTSSDKAAIIGIAIGVIVAVLAGASAALYLWRRQRVKKTARSVLSENKTMLHDPKEPSTRFHGAAEIDGNPISELDARSPYT